MPEPADVPGIDRCANPAGGGGREGIFPPLRLCPSIHSHPQFENVLRMRTKMSGRAGMIRGLEIPEHDGSELNRNPLQTGHRQRQLIPVFCQKRPAFFDFLSTGIFYTERLLEK